MRNGGKTEIVEGIKATLREVGIVKYATFIGGSFFFASEADHDRFFNGQSDVDIIVVCADDMNLGIALKTLFPLQIVEKFISGEYSVLNHTLRYGTGRNAFHIKFMSYRVFQNLIDLKPLSFKSFRPESLVKRKAVTSFASNNAQPCDYSYTEEEIENGYILHYQFEPIQDGNFYLSDLHSMILFSVCVLDTINARTSRAALFSSVRNILHHSSSVDSVLKTFQYFSKKGLLNEQWKMILLDNFWTQDKKGETLYFQDSL
jgi:hypothetical protein